MSATSDRIQVNRPAIIDETIDGEVVVVDLQQGSYYSIRDGGVPIWHSLIAPTTPDRVVRQIASRFGQPDADIAPSVTAFIDELHAHGLVRETEHALDSEPEPVDPAGVAEDEFRPPRLERFTDMEDLLMLDPVHEVDERGWPHAGPR